jgi:predicted RNA polymerase sigma factor
MAQRISRAKATIRAAGTTFSLPRGPEREERLRAVLHVLYLVFNEGYAAAGGAELQRREFAREAIRLTRAVRERLPADGETAGLLALMLLTDARSPARAAADGSLVPLDEQDRGRWDRAAVEEGIALVRWALAHTRLGPYQLQAAIAAVHAEAPTAEDTDWAQIAELYRLLERLAPNPVYTLNRAVAVGMTDGPTAGLALLAALEEDGRIARHHRLEAVRAHLLERAGAREAAIESYRAAAGRTTSLPERRHLLRRAHLLTTQTDRKAESP